MLTLNTAARDPWAHEEVEAGGYQHVPSLEHAELETVSFVAFCVSRARTKQRCFPSAFQQSFSYVRSASISAKPSLCTACVSTSVGLTRACSVQFQWPKLPVHTHSARPVSCYCLMLEPVVTLCYTETILKGHFYDVFL